MKSKLIFEGVEIVLYLVLRVLRSGNLNVQIRSPDMINRAIYAKKKSLIYFFFFFLHFFGMPLDLMYHSKTHQTMTILCTVCESNLAI